MIHPHGLLGLGALAIFHFVSDSQTLFAIAPLLFYNPLFVILGPHLGLVPANKIGILTALKMGQSLIILPGGIPEIICTEFENRTLFIKRRFGIFKLAQQQSVNLLPVLIVNEERMYNTVKLPCLKRRVYWSWRLNVPFLFPYPIGLFYSIIPQRVPLELEIGPVISSTETSLLALKKKYEVAFQCMNIQGRII